MKVTVKTDLTTLQFEKGSLTGFYNHSRQHEETGTAANLALSRPDLYKSVLNVKVTSDVCSFHKEATGLQFTTRLAAAQPKWLPTVRNRRIPASCLISLLAVAKIKALKWFFFFGSNLEVLAFLRLLCLRPHPSECECRRNGDGKGVDGWGNALSQEAKWKSKVWMAFWGIPPDGFKRGSQGCGLPHGSCEEAGTEHKPVS